MKCAIFVIKPVRSLLSDEGRGGRTCASANSFIPWFMHDYQLDDIPSLSEIGHWFPRCNVGIIFGTPLCTCHLLKRSLGEAVSENVYFMYIRPRYDIFTDGPSKNAQAGHLIQPLWPEMSENYATFNTHQSNNSPAVLSHLPTHAALFSFAGQNNTAMQWWFRPSHRQVGLFRHCADVITRLTSQHISSHNTAHVTTQFTLQNSSFNNTAHVSSRHNTAHVIT